MIMMMIVKSSVLQNFFTLFVIVCPFHFSFLHLATFTFIQGSYHDMWTGYAWGTAQKISRDGVINIPNPNCI